MRKAIRLWGIFILLSLALPVLSRPAVDLEFVPAPPGSGEYMFSAIAAGPDGKIYMGTAPTDVSFTHLLRYDPASGRVEDLADFRKLTGENDSRLIPQSKIHTQLVFDKQGLLWFGTHCHERDIAQDGGLSRFPKGYSGGYCFSFDPKSGRFDNRGILLPKKMEFPSSPLEYGESLISAAFDPARDILYFVSHPHDFLLAYHTKTRKLVNAGICGHWPPYEVSLGAPRDLKVTADGKVYLFTREGQILGYDPKGNRLHRLDIWLPGSDGKHRNMPYALAINRARTHIYGGSEHSNRLFELTVRPGKKPVLKDLGSSLPPGTARQDAPIHAITLSKDERSLFYTLWLPDARQPLMRYDLAARKLVPLGDIRIKGVPESFAEGIWGACTGQDGTVYLGGIAHAPERSLGYFIYRPIAIQ